MKEKINKLRNAIKTKIIGKAPLYASFNDVGAIHTVAKKPNEQRYGIIEKILVFLAIVPFTLNILTMPLTIKIGRWWIYK